MTTAPSIIYQAGKLGDLPQVRQDLALARDLDARRNGPRAHLRQFGRGAGRPGSRHRPGRPRRTRTASLPAAAGALDDFAAFFEHAGSGQIRRLNWRGLQYGFYHLRPAARTGSAPAWPPTPAARTSP